MGNPPRSLFASPDMETTSTDDGSPTILSREDCDAIFERLVKFANGRVELLVMMRSLWRGNVRWANNNITTAGDTTDLQVTVPGMSHGAMAIFNSTNQRSDRSLGRLIAVLDDPIKFPRYEGLPVIGPQHYLDPPLFFESTATLNAAERSRVGHELAQPVADAGLRSAGYLAVQSESIAVYTTNGLRAYSRSTNAQYSVTVRNTKDNGSGWAGVDKNDWTTIDAKAITERAAHKCVASSDPRAVEPGRFVTILEPQAVHDLMHTVLDWIDRGQAELGGPFFYRGDQSKLGMRVLDSRITISSDPMDPECGTYPFSFGDVWSAGEPGHKTSWITEGVLTELGYAQRYALESLGRSRPNPYLGGYRMSGGTVTMEDMIATTKRGVLVTRFSHMALVNFTSLLMTGVTRDGLWLIENGKITHAIKNFRFSDSPLFAFNAVEQLGEPVRVFSPDAPAVVPPVKVRDFNFIGLADAV